MEFMPKRNLIWTAPDRFGACLHADDHTANYIWRNVLVVGQPPAMRLLLMANGGFASGAHMLGLMPSDN